MRKRKPIPVYLTPDKLRHITASAKKVGIDRSAYIRHRCLNEDPKQELINRNLAQLLCNLANTVQELDGNEELCERLSSLDNLSGNPPARKIIKYHPIRETAIIK